MKLVFTKTSLLLIEQKRRGATAISTCGEYCQSFDFTANDTNMSPVPCFLYFVDSLLPLSP